MKRYEFEKMLTELENLNYDGGGMIFDNLENTQNAMRTLRDKRNAILTEFDRLTSEIDYLRWHYPSLGELPKLGEVPDHATREVIATHKLGNNAFAVWHPPSIGAPESFFEFYDSEYGCLNVAPDEIERWRYIE